jgi:hypothetical protein
VPRLIIKVANIAWLVIVFIGVPAATHAQIANWNITHASTGRMLVFVGLAMGVAANVLLAMTLKKHKDQILCWEWVAAFAGLLIVQYAYANRYLNFDWLKKALQWLQSKF